MKKCDVKIIALNEMANRQYGDGMLFSLEEAIRLNGKELSSIHFEPALSLGSRHTLCYRKKGRKGRREGTFLPSILPSFPSFLPFLPSTLLSFPSMQSVNLCFRKFETCPIQRKICILNPSSLGHGYPCSFDFNA